MKNALVLFLLFLMTSIQAQEENSNRGFLIKTLPIQDIFHKNPNLIIEKPINDKFSVDFLFALRYTDWIYESTSGIGAGPRWQQLDSDGFTIGGAFRFYPIKRQNAPNGLYVSATVRYNDILIDDVALRGDFDNNDSRRVDLDRKEIGFGALVGYQFRISRIAIDIYTGPGFKYRIEKENLVEGSDKYLEPKSYDWISRYYLGLSVGVKLF